MQYRRFGRLDWKVSALGFGCMRLPVKDEERTNIDEPEATRMLHYAIDHGVNYGYRIQLPRREQRAVPGASAQERISGESQAGHKLPGWKVEAPEDFDRLLNEQLERLQTDHSDFYLLHAMNRNWWPNVRDRGVFEWAERAIADGRIGHLGFSFHDEYPVFQEVVDAYDRWTFCQIQHNYMDTEWQAGLKGLKHTASKGLAVVIMEPLRGGKLVAPPPPIQEFWDAAPKKRTPADWALQWVWNQPEVSVVLSGMSAMQHVEENLASADASGIGRLTREELALVDRVREKYLEFSPIPCTECGYCMPCPNGVDIPYNFKLYNDGVMYERENPVRARWWYSYMVEGLEGEFHREKGQAVNCIQCRECEEKCPQGLPISEWMPIVHQVLGEDKSYDECSPPQFVEI